MDLPILWVRFADRHRGLLLALCTLAGLAGAAGTCRLYTDLRPSLSELLPAESRSALDAAAIARRMGGLSEETVILSGADPLALELVADDLVDRLAAIPPGLVRTVEARRDPIRDFYLPRLLFFPSVHELTVLRDALRARIDWERTQARRVKKERAGDPGAQMPRKPPPDVEGLLRGVAGGRAGVAQLLRQGYVAGEVPGRDGKRVHALAVTARLEGSPDDHGRVVAFDRAVKAAVASLDLAKNAPGVAVGYGGQVASSIREHEALAEDLAWATAFVLLAVALALALYNGTWKAVPAVGIPLLCGALATFGVAELAVGHLNSSAAFLGSIVVGNGAGAGIILFARYLEERRGGRGPLPAMETAVGQTWHATLTAALAAGVAYASLLSTDLRGFSQLGLVGGVGMGLAWLFGYAMTPPLVLAWERRAPIPRTGQRPARPLLGELVSRAVTRRPRALVAAAVALSVASACLVARVARDPVERDLRELRDRDALREGTPAWWDDRVDQLRGRRLRPTVLLARDPAEARAIAASLETHRDRTPGTRIGEVVSVAGLVPSGQEAKLPLVREIAALATPENLALLPPERRLALREALPPVELRPFGPGDLPPALRAPLTEIGGQVGAPVLVYPAAGMDPWDGRSVVAFAAELRGVPLPRPDVPMASSELAFADVLQRLEKDGPRATLLSLAGVVALVLLAFGAGGRSFRSLSGAGSVLAALGMGVLWLGGLAGALGLRLDMLDFAALPITFGVGVGYATNVFQRRRLDHARSIGDVVRTMGGAVALCAVTTIIGYASLVAGRNQALISFGLLAILGEVACLAAALLALPAVLRWRELRRQAAAKPGSPPAAARP